MPQAGFTPIQTYNSPTAGHIPVYTDLYAGELAINTTDEKLYFKNTGGTVKLLASTAVFTTTGSGSYVLATSPTITGHPTIEGVTSTGATGTGKFVFDSAPTITGHPTIEGVTSTGATGTGKFVFDSSPTLSGVTLSDGTANGVVYLNSSKVLTSGSGLVFDSSGNLGLGVAPSGNYTLQGQTNYNGGFKGFSLGAFQGGASGNGYPRIGYNIRLTSTADAYNYNDGDVASAIRFGDGINFYVASSGTAGNAISFTQAMTLDASGNLGIGATSPVAKLHVKGGNDNAAYFDNDGSRFTSIYIANNGTYKAELAWDNTQSQFIISADADPSSLIFRTSATERMRLNSSGNLLVGTTSGSYKITCNGQPGANGYTAWTNYSDERLKENIVDFVSEPVLNKICELRPVSFNYNDKTGFDEESRKRTVSGFIAQEMQQVFPDMVGKAMIGEEEYLDTNLSNLTLYLVKAIQELTARIEKLENKL